MGMNDRIKDAFDQIHAEDELKIRTKAFLASRMSGHSRPRVARYRRLIPAAVCLFFLLAGFGGYWAYFMPVAAISIDINPSLELGVNRFDRVVSVEGYNEDGRELASSLKVKYMDYEEAINQVLASESVTGLLSQDQVLTIAVIGQDEERCGRMLSHIESCTQGHENTYCYSAHPQEVAKAHEMGLSYGKYRAFLMLQSLDPTIMPEEIQGMTMREIQDWIQSLSGEDTGEVPDSAGMGGRHHGEGNGRGAGHGRGRTP